MNPVYKLSPQQKILLKGSRANFRCGVTVKGKGVIDLDRFKNAVYEVARLEPTLRTLVVNHGDQPVQSVGEREYIAFYFEKLDGPRSITSVSNCDDHVDHCIGPTCQVLASQYSDHYIINVLAAPVILDIRSLQLFVEKILCKYHGLVSEEPTSIPYIQYAEWANNTVATPLGSNFWKDRFPFAIDAKIVFQKAGKDDRRRMKVARFTDLQAGDPADVEVRMLSGWAITLWLLSGANKTHIGCYNNGREFSELGNSIGSYGKVLPFIVDIGSDDSLESVYSKVSTELSLINENKTFYTEQFDHNASYGFELLSPLVGNSMADVSCSELYNNTNIHDLKLSIVAEKDATAISFHYNDDVFAYQEVEYIYKWFIYFVSLSKQDKKTLGDRIKGAAWIGLDSARFKSKDFGANKSGVNVIGQFFECASKFPDNIAMFYGRAEISYAALSVLCRRASNFLTSQAGLKKGDRVAILAELPENIIVASLAVLHAGGCYVPIDTNNPKERKSAILSDCSPKIILVDHGGQKDYLNSDRVFYIETISQFELADLENAVNLTEDDAAYIMYTSGTTGNPKGSIIHHRALGNYTQWLIQTFDISSYDSSILLSSLNFDLSYTTFWGTLLSGAALHIVDDQLLKQPDDILSYIVDNEITFIKTTPTQFGLIMNGKTSRSKKVKLRLIFLGGEPIRINDVRAWLNENQNTEFVNHYGPTETAVGVVYHRFGRKDFEEFSRRPVIGEPITGNRVYILDADRLLPPGLVGEIVIAGSSVGKGYLNLPAITQKKFLKDPFYADQMMYRTGDLGVWTCDGKILFLGRADQQVKVRGYRIELSEIEDVITSLPQIKASASVVVSHLEYGNEINVFYVATSAIPEKQIWSLIKTKLPEYMWPSQICQVDEIPTTGNGKLNRKALLDKLSTRSVPELSQDFDDTQKKLYTIWQKVLGRSNFSMDDNFFELGGHSLKAIKIAAAIHRELNCKVSIRCIFENPTIRLLLKQIASNLPKEDFLSIPKAPMQEHYPLSHPQKRLWFLSQLEGGNVVYNMTFPVHIIRSLPISTLHSAFTRMMERHEILRTSFIAVEGQPRQKINEIHDLIFNIEHGSCDEANAHTGINEIIRDEHARPFDLMQAPLFRVKVIESTKGEQILIFTIHHIIIDAWSRIIFNQELAAIINSFESKRSDGLKPVNVQYKDYTCWMIEEMKKPYLQKQKLFWSSNLTNSITPLRLPTDYARPSISSFKGGAVKGKLDSILVNTVRHFARGQETTVFNILVGAFKLLLYRQTRNVNISIASPVAAREHDDLKDMIGMLTNLVVLRTELEPRWTFIKMTTVLKEVTSLAFANQLFPFDQLVQDLNIERNSDGASIIEAGFTWMADGKSSMAPKDKNWSDTLETPWSGSKFNLWLYAFEIDDEIVLILEYNSSLFKEERISMFLEIFKSILLLAVSNPQQSIESITQSPAVQGNDAGSIEIILNL